MPARSARSSSDHGFSGASCTAVNALARLVLDFEVEDVDGHYARLKYNVGDWVLRPTTMPWGNRAMLFRDPDGNLINFFSQPTRDERA